MKKNNFIKLLFIIAGVIFIFFLMKKDIILQEFLIAKIPEMNLTNEVKSVNRKKYNGQYKINSEFAIINGELEKLNSPPIELSDDIFFPSSSIFKIINVDVKEDIDNNTFFMEGDDFKLVVSKKTGKYIYSKNNNISKGESNSFIFNEELYLPLSLIAKLSVFENYSINKDEDDLSIIKIDKK